ncbi:cob(I)yrinic acid a c-diamide adenosyltransferase [Methylosinus sp. R-45379]|uniref:cob(I)yrinic acid a,c-diamide adenosyltransferase n=1 Tax=unclassified Methylosinus TaxID=2624500 RepID=UPI000467271D|nr:MULTISPECIES: cob(I)yrinic acid a,c-diamide adenosyltransferase [unclassified Methylosinus]OAI23547.1 cob(I)yrinic acid a c-diamide adenosyltransferase [Methylosinus sp. R-45379]TDX66527.1 ATP:cob(I)alamin adenosyltransferase [Methylosinus sp. sav-2]
MVRLDKIYTRGGDAGATSLVGGERRRKDDLRVEAYGAVDETNAAIGLARLATGEDAALDAMLERIQSDLFDLGAELATPLKPGEAASENSLAIVQSQVDRLEREIDELNATLAPLKSFVLPGGTAAAAHLHLARTVSRRAERIMVALANAPEEAVGATALRYVNRLSDFLFVAARYANKDRGDVLWTPGATR